MNRRTSDLMEWSWSLNNSMIQSVDYPQGSIQNLANTKLGKINTNSSDRNMDCHCGDHDPNIPIITYQIL